MRRLLARLLARVPEHYCACGEPLERFWFAGPYGHLSRCPAERARAEARDAALTLGKDPERWQFLAVRRETTRLHGTDPDRTVVTFWDVLHQQWVGQAVRRDAPDRTTVVSVQHGTRRDALEALLGASP